MPSTKSSGSTSHLRLGFYVCVFPFLLRFRTKICAYRPTSHACHSFDRPLFNHESNTTRRAQINRLVITLCSSSHLGAACIVRTNILHSISFSKPTVKNKFTIYTCIYYWALHFASSLDPWNTAIHLKAHLGHAIQLSANNTHNSCLSKQQRKHAKQACASNGHCHSSRLATVVGHYNRKHTQRALK
jgi:hypothetical protein